MKNDLTGKVFTWLRVLKFNGVNKKKQREWLCLCKCGKYKIATSFELTSGRLKSCGCYNSKRYNTLIGQFGKLTIIDFVGVDKNGYKLYKCKCDCGNEVIVKGCCLNNGHTKSCGCDKGKGLRKHGFCAKDSRLYDIYNGMWNRCYNPKATEYNIYGGRGIGICKQWLEDIGEFFDFAYKNGYSKNKTIDRIESNAGYCPENCRFVSKKMNTLRALFKRWNGYDPSDKEIEENYGWKESI